MVPATGEGGSCAAKEFTVRGVEKEPNKRKEKRTRGKAKEEEKAGDWWRWQ